MPLTQPEDPEDEYFEVDEPDSEAFERFSCLLQQALSSGDCDGLATAAHILGHLARVRGSMAAESVERELRRSLEWLQHPQGLEPSRHRHAACLVITELAENAPTLLFVHIREVFGHVWTAVRDARLAVREAAARALRACLRVVGQREHRLVAQWYDGVYDNAMYVIRRHAAATAPYPATRALSHTPPPLPHTPLYACALPQPHATASPPPRRHLAAQSQSLGCDPRLAARAGRAARLARRAESQRRGLQRALAAAVCRGVRSRVGREGASRAAGDPCRSLPPAHPTAPPSAPAPAPSP